MAGTPGAGRPATDMGSTESPPVHTRRRTLQLSGVALLATGAGCSVLGGNPTPEDRARRHREALSRYTDVGRAQADTYLMSVPYVRKETGNLSLPFVKPDAPRLDPDQPNVLFYDLAEDGTFELAGVEWFVPADAADAPPTLFGRRLDGPTAGETAAIPDHYGLHAWLFEDNPEGLFAPTHPGLSPPSYIGQLDTLWDTFAPFYTDPDRAERAGYRNTETCLASEAGGYGVPFVNPDRIGSELTEPAVLLYRLLSTWNYVLMGAEWYVPAGTRPVPTLFDRAFHEPMAGHGRTFDQGSHRGLHAWFFAANPSGMFAPFNPSLSC